MTLPFADASWHGLGYTPDARIPSYCGVRYVSLPSPPSRGRFRPRGRVEPFGIYVDRRVADAARAVVLRGRLDHPYGQSPLRRDLTREECRVEAAVVKGLALATVELCLAAGWEALESALLGIEATP